jgi:hypothetical protein
MTTSKSFAVLMLLVAPIVSCSRDTTAPHVVTAETTGIVTGVVFDELTNEPVTGVGVTALPENGQAGRTAVTDNFGKFTFNNLLTGRWLISVTPLQPEYPGASATISVGPATAAGVQILLLMPATGVHLHITCEDNCLQSQGMRVIHVWRADTNPQVNAYVCYRCSDPDVFLPYPPGEYKVTVSFLSSEGVRYRPAGADTVHEALVTAGAQTQNFELRRDANSGLTLYATACVTQQELRDYDGCFAKLDVPVRVRRLRDGADTTIVVNANTAGGWLYPLEPGAYEIHLDVDKIPGWHIWTEYSLNDSWTVNIPEGRQIGFGLTVMQH